MASLKQYPEIKYSKAGKQNKAYITRAFKVNKQSQSILVPSANSTIAPIRQSTKKPYKLMEIIFHGLNLSTKRKRLKRLDYIVDVHKSELFLCSQKWNSEYKLRTYKRRLLFIANDSKLLDLVTRYIKDFKYPNIYTGKGLFLRSDKYNVKKGKEYKK